MLALVLAFALPTAEAGKEKKIEKALAAYEAGDAEGLPDALERIPKTLEKAPDDPAVLLAVGRVYLAIALDPSAVPFDGNAMEQALATFEKVQAAGAEGEIRAGLEAAVPKLVSAQVAELTNLVDGKQWADATPAVALAVRALALEQALGLEDAVRTGTAEKLATRVAAANGDAAGAREHYARFAAVNGADDTALASLVARKTAESGDLEGAIAFLSPIAEKANTDEALLRVQMDLFLQAEKTDDALARLDAIQAEMTGSVSGGYLIGQLYQQLGAEDKARAAFEGVLARDPNHTDSSVELGKSWWASYERKKAELDSAVAAKRPSRETKSLQALVATALAESEKRALAAVASGPSSIPAHELLAKVEGALVSRLPAKPRSTKDKAAAQAMKDRLAATTKRLEELKAEQESTGGVAP